MSDSMLDAYLTTQEASDHSGLSQSQIQYLLRKGKISGIRKGRIWLVSRIDLEEYMLSDRKPGPKPASDSNQTDE